MELSIDGNKFQVKKSKKDRRKKNYYKWNNKKKEWRKTLSTKIIDKIKNYLIKMKSKKLTKNDKGEYQNTKTHSSYMSQVTLVKNNKKYKMINKNGKKKYYFFDNSIGNWKETNSKSIKKELSKNEKSERTNDSHKEFKYPSVPRIRRQTIFDKIPMIFYPNLFKPIREHITIPIKKNINDSHKEQKIVTINGDSFKMTNDNGVEKYYIFDKRGNNWKRNNSRRVIKILKGKPYEYQQLTSPIFF